MSGCQTCGGYGMHHDPIAHGSAHEPECGTCNGSGIAPDHSPQPDDEQPCPECMTAAPTQVRRIHTDDGSHIEPPLDDDWDDLTKLSWHLAVTLLDAGLPQTGMVVRLLTGGTGPLDDFPMYQLGIPGYCIGPLSYAAMWDVINGVEFGVRAAREAL